MKHFLTLLSIVVLGVNVCAQDPLFTQKIGNINHFNPALVGTQSNFGVQLNYRNQWPASNFDIQTLSLLANYRFVGNVGVALEAFADGNSITQHNRIKANLNYEHTAGDFELRYGTNLGIGQYNIDIESLRFENQIDPSQGFVNPTAEPFEYNPSYYMLFDLGASAYYKGFMLGVSSMQLNHPKYDVFGTNTRLKARHVATLGYLKEFDKLALAGLATIQHQNKSSVLETQAFAQYKFVKLGFGYHQVFGQFTNADFFSVSAGVQFDKFSVGYSYDNQPFTPTRKAFVNTHQATAAWYIKGLNTERGMSRLLNVFM